MFWKTSKLANLASYPDLKTTESMKTQKLLNNVERKALVCSPASQSHFAMKIRCLLDDLFLDHFGNGLEDVL